MCPPVHLCLAQRANSAYINSHFAGTVAAVVLEGGKVDKERAETGVALPAEEAGGKRRWLRG